MNLLVVEDDDSIGRLLRQACEEAGYRARLVRDGATGLQAGRSGGYDLVLLDVMLPELGGFEVCRRLRAAGVRTPVLIITARDSVQDKIEGLDSGADDYVVKPFHVAELLARMRALLRRGAPIGPELCVADLRLDPDKRLATRAGMSASLSATEYALLEYLMRNAGRVLPRAMIMEHVWQYDFDGNDSVLDVYIHYLRDKLDRGHARPLIHTVRGVGYRLCDSHDD